MDMFLRDQAARSRVCRDVCDEARAEQPAAFQLQAVVIIHEFRRIMLSKRGFSSLFSIQVDQTAVEIIRQIIVPADKARPPKMAPHSIAIILAAISLASAQNLPLVPQLFSLIQKSPCSSDQLIRASPLWTQTSDPPPHQTSPASRLLRRSCFDHA